jgi:Mn2+/Fe2+ NRAMP family transporter
VHLFSYYILYKQLLWIVLVGLTFALIIQSLSANLGVATGFPLCSTQRRACLFQTIPCKIKIKMIYISCILILTFYYICLQESILLSIARQSTQLQ